MHAADCSAYSFWLDPLCVPLASVWKRPAVEKMDKVYAKASKVIVIDRDLMRCRGNNILRRMTMIVSDWNTRLWTLQEAVLPGDRLFVAFNDGVKNVNTIIKDWWDEDGLSTQSLIIGSSETINLQSSMCTGGAELIRLVENFHNRTVTNPDDEAICLAILLGLDICRLPIPASVSDAIELLQTVEQDILFAPGARATRIGHRWCPASFVAATRRKIYEASQISVKRSKRGIKVEKDAMFIESFDFQGLARETADTTAQYLLLVEDHFPPLIAFCEAELGADLASLRSRRLEDVVLIFERPLALSGEQSTAVLASGVRSEDGDLCAHFECLTLTLEYTYFIKRDQPDVQANILTLAAKRHEKLQIWVD